MKPSPSCCVDVSGAWKSLCFKIFSPSSFLVSAEEHTVRVPRTPWNSSRASLSSAMTDVMMFCGPSGGIWSWSEQIANSRMQQSWLATGNPYQHPIAPPLPCLGIEGAVEGCLLGHQVAWSSVVHGLLSPEPNSHKRWDNLILLFGLREASAHLVHSVSL